MSWQRLLYFRTLMKRLANTIALLLVFLGNTSRAQFSIVIDGKKDSFYSQLLDSTDGYLHISHADFLPMSGPSPKDEADLSADVWIAWDDTYFYLYAEVKDDVVRVSSSVRPWNDCIELKFDPDPSKRSLTGIVNARLTALDTADASEVKGVDNLYPERDSLLSREAAKYPNFARRRTNDGYDLELRLAWDWIKCKDRSLRVGVGNVFGLAINIHDNDGATRRRGAMERNHSIQWSAGMADAVWLVPQLLGTVEFKPDHKLKFIRRNAIDTSDVRTKTFLSLAQFKFRETYPISIENWRYQTGDNRDWAQPEFDDRGWDITSARLTKDQKPRGGWNGVGWFRTQLVVDSSLWGVPLGFRMNYTGASEVYLDGALLYRFGTVGSSKKDEKAFLDRNVKPIVFKDKGAHLLAVRYSNFSTEYFVSLGMDAGFTCSLFHNLEAEITRASDATRGRTLYQVIFVLLPIVIGAVHLFFFFFYPRGKENLAFALFMFCWAYVVFADYQGAFATDVILSIERGRSSVLAIGGALVFGMLTIYLGIYQKLPMQFYAIAVVAGGTAAMGILYPTELAVGYILYGLIGLLGVEILRVFVAQWRAGSRQKWITACGVGLFILALMWQILAGMAILPGITSYAYIYAYGLLILSVCVSIDLSRSYASATKNLELQLVHVKALSDKALEQERRAKDEELSRRMLEADNTRKTRELDEARQVQLSMLPKEIPRLPQLDIAVKMETATEVGGDYYDFHLADDGALTIALGDATGHGTKAGTMVSITKGLFHELAGLQSLTAIFGRFTTAIKHMNLGQLYMGLLLVRIKDHTLTASAAGMPPIFLYRAATHTSELVVMKGMPLGQFEAFPYQIRELALSPGDTILLMSDGLIEMFNEQDETFDESRVVEAFTRVGSKSPQEIISHLVEEGEKWANGKLQADDVTLVVLKTR